MLTRRLSELLDGAEQMMALLAGEPDASGLAVFSFRPDVWYTEPGARQPCFYYSREL